MKQSPPLLLRTELRLSSLLTLLVSSWLLEGAALRAIEEAFDWHHADSPHVIWLVIQILTSRERAAGRKGMLAA
eukprot:1576155-Rhodomonas_salina.1